MAAMKSDELKKGMPEWLRLTLIGVVFLAIAFFMYYQLRPREATSPSTNEPAATATENGQ